VAPILGQREREIDLEFTVARPQAVRRAELQVVYRRVWPLQFIDLSVNGKASLVVRPPETDPPFYKWETAFAGLHPALLLPGSNRVRVRVMPIPGVTEQRLAHLNSVTLRTISVP
jgi:hypothetical protein